jgi:hypothetical protein
LAGREEERREFLKILDQGPTILENPILTGLRGVGKTVLLDTFKPLARSKGWLWVGTDLSESATLTEGNMATRLITDVSIVSSQFTVPVESNSGTVEQPLDVDFLIQRCDDTPGLISDKLKAALELVHEYMPSEYRGIIFAYDEAQLLSDHAERDEYPLSVLLEVFQSLQRKDIPFMLLLTGLPTLFPKLVEARTYAERMFRVLFLQKLSQEESRAAITTPIAKANCPVRFTDDSIDLVCELSGGYPYFIQFICREVYDVFQQQHGMGTAKSVPTGAIIKKLDSDFFAGRWARATDRQRELLWVIANLPNHGAEFSVREIVEHSKQISSLKGFSSSHANQMLVSLSDAGLVYKNRYGRYSFAVPLLDRFIRRQGLN